MDRNVNRFRIARGHILRAQIAVLAENFRRSISVLDVGGRPEYWDNVGYDSVERIEILNYNKKELESAANNPIFVKAVGDARSLGYGDKSFDLVHSNSVIEHVGSWPDMLAMASEVRRVGLAGWVQTPAWEFPIEPHFRAPFLHWFGQPLRRRMLSLSRRYRRYDTSAARGELDQINLVSRTEIRALFPDCAIMTERVMLLPKSYVARWMPDGLSP